MKLARDAENSLQHDAGVTRSIMALVVSIWMNARAIKIAVFKENAWTYMGPRFPESSVSATSVGLDRVAVKVS